MELPKIKNEDLPEELRKILGDQDAEFDPICDPRDVIRVPLDIESYMDGRLETAQQLIQERQNRSKKKARKPKSIDKTQGS